MPYASLVLAGRLASEVVFFRWLVALSTNGQNDKFQMHLMVDLRGHAFGSSHFSFFFHCSDFRRLLFHSLSLKLQWLACFPADLTPLLFQLCTFYTVSLLPKPIFRPLGASRKKSKGADTNVLLIQE